MSKNAVEGFSLLEIMLVITVILLIATISEPFYMTGIERTREAVLRDDLSTMRVSIERFTLDNQRAPASLEELVEKGYLERVPTDPFIGSNETWEVEREDEPISPGDSTLGIVDVHSGSDALSLNGTPYSSW